MSKNFAKMAYIIPNFLVLHFGENFTKISTKMSKLQMHENLHKNVNENYLYHLQLYAIFHELLWWAVKATNMLQLYLYNAYFYMFFNPFKMHQVFPILMVQMLFSQIQQAPGPRLKKGRKIIYPLSQNSMQTFFK